MSDTQVVNVKVNYIRPSFKNLAEWMKNTDNVYIARRGIVFISDIHGNKKRYPDCDSPFANPFKISTSEPRELVLNKYESYIRKRLTNEPNLVQELLKLDGKNLGCWCAPEPCHGDILIKLIKEYKQRNNS